jgi:Cys-rich protein (TIGR01571 family)
MQSGHEMESHNANSVGVTDVEMLVPARPAKWSTRLCACGGPSCIHVFWALFATSSAIVDLADRMEQRDVYQNLGWLGRYLGKLRTRLRNTYGIEGDEGVDCLISGFCLSCVVGQMHRELSARGHPELFGNF